MLDGKNDFLYDVNIHSLMSFAFIFCLLFDESRQILPVCRKYHENCILIDECIPKGEDVWMSDLPEDLRLSVEMGVALLGNFCLFDQIESFGLSVPPQADFIVLDLF